MTSAVLAALALAAAPQARTGDLPPPLPPPLEAEAAPSDPGTFPGDPLEFLWGHRLDFEGGEPVVAIRLAEGRDELAVLLRGPTRIEPRSAPGRRAAPGMALRARVRGTTPAGLSWSPLLARLDAGDRDGLERARALWASRGVGVRVRSVGGVYGIAGRVVDNRQVLVVAAGSFTEGSATAFAADAWNRFGERTEPVAEVLALPAGRVELLGPDGAVVAAGDRVVTLDARADGVSLDGRAYRGRLHLTVDARGALAAILVLPLEELLRGLVPSEMPAGAPPEALRAQAVTARSNVLAQIGTRHLADPWSLCSDVHCQAYRGEGAQVASTDAAVRATRGEVLVARGGRLVDGVYSAMCGGHGEDNDAVWGGTPSENLRGHPDLEPGASGPWAGGLARDAVLAAFLSSAPPAWCARAPGARPDRYRWERPIPQSELDRMLAPLGLGPIDGLEVVERGASGRAISLRVDGERGSATVHGELRIRRLLGDLPSAMFLLERVQDGYRLRGGGWGHGVGMCQWGAIGRAAAGQEHARILGAYYPGAAVAHLY